MSIIIPANSATGGGGFDAANSVRFDDASSDYFRWNSAPSGNRQKFTWSAWFKRSSVGATQILASASYSGGDEGYLFLSGGGVLGWQSTNSGDGNLTTAMLWRDLSAWYHVVFSVDTTQSTATNRIKLYVNGSQYTWDGNTTQPNQNQSLYWNVGGTYYPYIGRRNGGDYFDGYMAEIVQVNNAQLAADSFGEFDEDSGIWKPIDVSGLTFGDTGYYLNFQDSSALGNDVSGENHDWTSYNLAAIDQTTDTCTNNFATLNPLIPFGGTFSEGNLQHTRSSSGYRSAVSSIGAKTGKWYVEIKSPDDENMGVGVINGDNAAGLYMSGSEQFLGQHSYDAGYYFNGILYVGNSSQSGSWTSYTSNDIIGIALDADNGYVYFSKNGSFVNSGNPASGSSGTGGYALSGIGSSGTYFIGCSTGNNSEHYVNFGNPIFSISSGNADGDGFGNFEYAVPSGYFALCTKNLAEYG